MSFFFFLPNDGTRTFFERPAFLGPTHKLIVRWSTVFVFIVKKSTRLKKPDEEPVNDFATICLSEVSEYFETTN